jgi:hypothetical protein
MTTSLVLDGIPVYVSGVSGHFTDAWRCNLRMCWRIGALRISTVGGYLPDGPDGYFDTVGSGRWSETMIFRVEDDHRGLEPEGIVTDPCGVTVTCVAGQSTRDAERLHLLIAVELAAVHNDTETRLHDDEIDEAVAQAHARMGEP